jgi:prolyl-tRNA synthetase
MRGVPLRIEIGPKEVAKRQVSIFRRDTRDRESVPVEEITGCVQSALEKVQTNLLRRAQEYRDRHILSVGTLAELQGAIAEGAGFARAFWCGDSLCEGNIKQDTGATIRCIPVESPDTGLGGCISCRREGTNKVIFAKAY